MSQPIAPRQASLRAGYPGVTRDLAPASPATRLAQLDDLTAAIESAGNNIHSIFRLCQQPGINLNGADSRGRTPLSVACAFGRALAVETLLDLGCESSLRDPVLGR